MMRCVCNLTQGAQGEYAGLLAIRRYHRAGEEKGNRHICFNSQAQPMVQTLHQPIWRV